jgi:putative oxidoreductase
MKMEFGFLARWQPQILALLRIMTGLLFLEHGTAKLFGFPVFPEGMPHPLPTLILASAVIELVCGLLVTLGLFTRLAAFIASGEMAVAYFMGHASKGFWPIVNMGEPAILYCFIFLFLAAAGAGAWSVDGARSHNAAVR